MTATPERQHNPALDGLRGVAILLVLAFHSTAHTAGWGMAYRPFTKAGWAGVDLFFVLSGFLITGVLLDSRGERKYWSNFYARRALRILPPYVVFLTLVLCLAPHLQFLVRGAVTPPAVWFWTYASNVYIARHGWTGSLSLDPSWSLAVEEQFYLAWPVAVFFLSRKWLLLMCALLMPGALLFRAACHQGLLGPDGNVAAYVSTLARIDDLGAGAFVAMLTRGSNIAAWRKVAVAVGTVAGAWLSSLWWRDLIFGTETLGQTTVVLTALAVFFGSVLLIVTAQPKSLVTRILSARALVVAGKYSYALYLVHMVVICELRQLSGSHWWSPTELSPWLAPLYGSLISAGASMFIAWLSWNLLEKHALGLKRFF